MTIILGASNQYHKDVDSGLWNPSTGHHGIPHFVDYLTAIGIGEVTGHEPIRNFGYREGLTTSASGDDLWGGAATTMPIPNQTTGEQMTLVSTSANDSASGSGARTIHIHYLDAAGVYNYEIVTLNGTTPVNTVATNIRFVNQIHVITNGSFGAYAAGNISIYKAGAPATVYSVIAAGSNISLSSAMIVPAGKTFYLNQVKASATSTKPLTVRLRATCSPEGVIFPGVFMFQEIFALQDSTSAIELYVPRQYPEFTILKASAFSSQSGGSAECSYSGWLE